MGLCDPKEQVSSTPDDRSTCPTTNGLESPSVSDGSSDEDENGTPDYNTKEEPVIRYTTLDFRMTREKCRVLYREFRPEESSIPARNPIPTIKREMEDNDEGSESESLEYHRQRWYTEINFRRAVETSDYSNPGCFSTTDAPLRVRSSDEISRLYPHWNLFMNTYSQ